MAISTNYIDTETTFKITQLGKNVMAQIHAFRKMPINPFPSLCGETFCFSGILLCGAGIGRRMGLKTKMEFHHLSLRLSAVSVGVNQLQLPKEIFPGGTVAFFVSL